jgi:hypothetical protein
MTLRELAVQARQPLSTRHWPQVGPVKRPGSFACFRPTVLHASAVRYPCGLTEMPLVLLPMATEHHRRVRRSPQPTYIDLRPGLQETKPFNFFNIYKFYKKLSYLVQLIKRNLFS